MNGNFEVVAPVLDLPPVNNPVFERVAKKLSTVALVALVAVGCGGSSESTEKSTSDYNSARETAEFPVLDTELVVDEIIEEQVGSNGVTADFNEQQQQALINNSSSRVIHEEEPSEITPKQEPIATISENDNVGVEIELDEQKSEPDAPQQHQDDINASFEQEASVYNNVQEDAIVTASNVPERYQPSDDEALFIIMPHLDDEWQAWAEIEGRTERKIFVSMTRSEQSVYCEPGMQTPITGAWVPEPLPQGRWTESCEQARINAMLEFLNRMSTTIDPTIPGNFSHTGRFLLPSHGGSAYADLCREDNGVVDCNTSFDVFTDLGGRGQLLVFDAGDRDVTQQEVSSVISRLRDFPDDYKLEEGTQFTQLIGASFYNDGAFSNCYSYRHPDHLAVRDALLNKYFQIGPQVVSTCATDPLSSFTKIVSEKSRRAFTIDPLKENHGAHVWAYSWLTGTTEQSFALSPNGDQLTELWHIGQSFAVNNGDNPGLSPTQSSLEITGPAVAGQTAERIQQ